MMHQSDTVTDVSGINYSIISDLNLATEEISLRGLYLSEMVPGGDRKPSPGRTG